MPARPTIDDLDIDDYDAVASDRTGTAALSLIKAGGDPFEYMRTPGLVAPACHAAVARWVRATVAAGPSVRLVELVDQAIECDADDHALEHEETPPTATHFRYLAGLIVRADRVSSWSRKGTCRRRAAILRDLAIALRDGAGQAAADSGRLDVLGLVAGFVGRHLTEAA